MSFLRLGLSMLLVNLGSAFNAYLGYKCVIAGHEGFAIAFIVLAFVTNVTLKTSSE